MVPTALVAVARLGGRAGFVGKVGDDPTGERITGELREYDVDTARCVVEPGATSNRTVVLVDGRTGARSFLSDRGTAAAIGADEVDLDYVRSARVLHLSDAGEAALAAARAMKEAGGEVGFDGTHFHPSLWPLIPLVDYLIVSRFFASEFAAHVAGRGAGRAAQIFATEHGAPAHPAALHPSDEGAVPALAGEQLMDAARQLRRHGPRVVVVTEGELGSWCASAAGELHTPAFAVSPVVDTTGAGDVFHGAFLYGRTQGWDLETCLKLASATAALKCRRLGGRAGIPHLEEARRLIDSSGTDTEV
jgi:ribokinase